MTGTGPGGERRTIARLVLRGKALTLLPGELTIGEAPMRQPLNPNQQRRVEEFVRRKGESCVLCGSEALRCADTAATYIGGGFNVRLICTNAEDPAHTGRLGLVWNYSITADEAERISL
jgi:hypothetical protein